MNDFVSLLTKVTRNWNKVDNSNEYSMRETRNVTVSLPSNPSNNNKRPMTLVDDSDDSDDNGEEYFTSI